MSHNCRALCTNIGHDDDDDDGDVMIIQRFIEDDLLDNFTQGQTVQL